jgi:2-(3-amino-3-carboxypropyl)histidine synthase
MKIEYFEARAKIELPEITQELIDLVKNKSVALFTTVQFLEQRNNLAVKLLKYCKVVDMKLAHCKYPDQILGCSAFDSEIAEKPSIFIYLGDGVFHPKSLVLKDVADEVYCLSPIDFSIKKITKEDVSSLIKKRNGALSGFTIAKNIGILITTKPGQNNLKKALELKSDKNIYYFLDDTINFAELENFNFIDCWVNTACPRIAYDDSIKIDKPIVNLGDLQ